MAPTLWKQIAHEIHNSLPLNPFRVYCTVTTVRYTVLLYKGVPYSWETNKRYS